MADINKVATLINKLLALSKDGGATEAEAALAAEKAQELMTQHNLSMASVETAGGQSGDEGQRVKDRISHRQVYKWQRTLMAALAELNFCHCQEKYESGRDVFDGYILIGRAANVASTRVMFEYLLQSIDRLAKAEMQDPAQFFTRYAHSFKEGCADRVIERLQERRAKEVEASERRAREDKARNSHPAAATSNALVVVLGDYVQDENDLNEDFRRGRPPGTTKAERLEYEREQAEYDAKRKAEYERRKAEWLARDPDIDASRLEYLAWGFSPERVNEILKPAKPSKPETEAQRIKRLVKNERERQRWQERQWRQDAKKDWNGYSKGQKAGDSVGLDQQVGRGSTKGIT